MASEAFHTWGTTFIMKRLAAKAIVLRRVKAREHSNLLFKFEAFVVTKGRYPSLRNSGVVHSRFVLGPSEGNPKFFICHRDHGGRLRMADGNVIEDAITLIKCPAQRA